MKVHKSLKYFFALLILFPVMAFGIEVGQPAPNFSLPQINATKGAKNVELNSLRGKIVVLDFWASWCDPCIQAFPELDAIQREFGASKVRVLAVSIDEEEAVAKAALGSKRHNFTALLDADSAVSERYGVGGSLPATAIIDAQGRVRFFNTGSNVTGKTLRQTIRSLLNN